jgi:uncharacterized membrane protein
MTVAFLQLMLLYLLFFFSFESVLYFPFLFCWSADASRQNVSAMNILQGRRRLRGRRARELENKEVRRTREKENQRSSSRKRKAEKL